MNDRYDRFDRYDRPVRLVAAILVLGGGLVHYRLWSDGYQDIDRVGPMFIVNVVASLGLAVALVAWRHWAPVVGALGLVNGTLVAFGISRTDWDILGFNERGFEPSPEAVLTLVFEIGAAAALALLLWWTPLPGPFGQRSDQAVETVRG